MTDYRKRLEAVANLIQRPPADDVLLERTVAEEHAADLRQLLAESDRLRSLVEEAGKVVDTADKALASIPQPRVNDGAHVVWAVGDDVPEDISVARSWLAEARSLLDKLSQPDGGKP